MECAHPKVSNILLNSVLYLPKIMSTALPTAWSLVRATSGRSKDTAVRPSETPVLTREFPARRTPTKEIRDMTTRREDTARLQITTCADRDSFLHNNKL